MGQKSHAGHACINFLVTLYGITGHMLAKFFKLFRVSIVLFLIIYQCIIFLIRNLELYVEVQNVDQTKRL